MQLNQPTTNLSDIAKYLQDTNGTLLIDINNQPFILKPATWWDEWRFRKGEKSK